MHQQALAQQATELGTRFDALSDEKAACEDTMRQCQLKLEAAEKELSESTSQNADVCARLKQEESDRAAQVAELQQSHAQAMQQQRDEARQAETAHASEMQLLHGHAEHRRYEP